MFYEIPKKIIRNINNPNRIIPYTIYQTFKTNLVPKSMYDSAKSYIDINTIFWQIIVLLVFFHFLEIRKNKNYFYSD